MDITKNIVESFSVITGNDTISIIVSVLLVILGFYLLMKGADVFVEGAAGVAEKLRVPLIIIGLTIVAFGTSAPEAAISITSAAKGSAGIAIGNVLGSNIMNILFILGITAFFAKVPVNKETFRYEIPFVLIITVVLTIIGIIGWNLNKADGLILFILFIIFMVYLFVIAKNGSNTEDIISESPENSEKAKPAVWLLVIMILFGLIMIILGSDMTVYAASNIAFKIGISERVIGLTIVALGTSLPELVTSVSAARKGKTEIAVGNIIGSNIFNILFVLSLSAVVSPKPIDFSSQFIFDSIIAILTPALLWLLLLKNKKLTRTGGLIMIAMYAIYLVFIII